MSQPPYQESHHRVEELVALNRITQTIASTRNLHAMLSAISQEVVSLFNVSSTGIVLCNPDLTNLTVAAAYTVHQDIPDVVGTAIPLTPAISKLFKASKPIIISNAQTTALTRPFLHLLRARKIHSTMVIPLRLRGKNIGAIAINSDQPHRYFSPADMYLAEMIATQIAVAIEDIRLSEKEQQQRQLVESLQEISAILNVNLNQNTVLTNIMGQLGRVITYDKAYVFLQNQDVLSVCSRVGDSVAPMEFHIPLSENCPAIQVFKEKAALVLPNVRMKSNGLTEPDEIPIRSWMGVPLLTGEEAIGVLSIERYEIDAYQEEDTRVLQAFANHAAIAIRNAQLYQELMGAHKKLQEQNAQLTELNESKDKFFSIISHDLRSPFTVMLTFAHLLVEELEYHKEEHLKMMAQKFQNYAEKFYALLENLLTWTRIQRGIMQCRPTKFDLYVAIENTMELFLQKAEDKGIALKNLVPKQTHVHADYSMVGTVLRNLISNALKFTEARGEITISAHPLDTFVEVTILDTGCGIPQDSLAKLFRIDEKYVRDGINGERGTGFGLILCHDLIEQNGGRIWANSEESKGSAFMFTLLKSPLINHH